MREIRFKMGEIVVREGDRGTTMYIIRSGKVGVYNYYGKEEQVQITTLTPGDMFGEMALLEGYPRSTTVVALEEQTSLEEISRSKLQRLLTTDTDFVIALMKLLSHRLRNMTQEYLDACITVRDISRSGQDGKERSAGLIKRIKSYIRQAKYRKDISLNSLEAVWHQELKQGAEQEEVRPRLRCQPGVPIFRAGDPSDCMYYIYLGEVGIYANRNGENEKRLTVLKEGSFFGEMGMIEHLPRSAGAYAESDGTYVEPIRERDIERLMKSGADFVVQILMHLSSPLCAMKFEYLDVCTTIEAMLKAEEEKRELDIEYLNAAATYTIYASGLPGSLYI